MVAEFSYLLLHLHDCDVAPHIASGKHGAQVVTEHWLWVIFQNHKSDHVIPLLNMLQSLLHSEQQISICFCLLFHYLPPPRAPDAWWVFYPCLNEWVSINISAFHVWVDLVLGSLFCSLILIVYPTQIYYCLDYYSFEIKNSSYLTGKVTCSFYLNSVSWLFFKTSCLLLVFHCSIHLRVSLSKPY